MNEAELERRAIEIMQRPYHKVLHGSAAGGYFVEVLELPGCWTDGETEEEALINLREAMVGWLMTRLDHGDPIPEPLPGDAPCRSIIVPETLHSRLDRRATAAGLSTDAVAAEILAAALAVPQY
jgi:antitoxin HicB